MKVPAVRSFPSPILEPFLETARVLLLDISGVPATYRPVRAFIVEVGVRITVTVEVDENLIISRR